ncbi:MAG TPA: cation:proton antiporter [Pyrinomonadaceae bacterium]|nr:cation:proton antiporter [Pyrinomonadaceae bacterium]
MQLYKVILLKPGNVCKTSSGKIRRHARRNNFLDNGFEIWGCKAAGGDNVSNIIAEGRRPSMKSSFTLYVGVLLIFGLGIYIVLSFGSRLRSERAASTRHDETSAVAMPASQRDGLEGAWGNIGGMLREHLREPLSILLLQVSVIVITAKLVGDLFLKIGQPSVIGEMVAGIILGPSLLGMLFPKASSFLFPASSVGTLKSLSQIGVILFMFIVGMNMNARYLREKARAAVIISHASIIAPFFLGVTVSLLTYPRFAPSNIPFISFALFMGVAMSVTAFPVLARIVEERGMSNSPLGSTVIACAAVDDVTAWCVLATVIAVVKVNGIGPSAMTVFLILTFITFMLFILKPRLNRAIGGGVDVQKNGVGVMVAALIIVFISSYITEVVGVHAIFGAFLAGAVMPASGAIRSFLRDKLTTFSSAALLPLFFAFTGLRTQIGLLNDWQSWLACAGIIGVAIAGKLGGSTVAARMAGMNWPDSLSIGVLMNTRGLIELVVLNIGYDLGILPDRIFAIMVLMALTTTCITAPLLSLIGSVTRKGAGQESLATTA